MFDVIEEVLSKIWFLSGRLCIIAVIAVIVITPLYWRIKHARDCKKIYAARDALNRRFEETGSPARYSCPYDSWRGVEDYDEDPAKEAVKFMKESLEKYNSFLALGGNPETIDDVWTLWKIFAYKK